MHAPLDVGRGLLVRIEDPRQLVGGTFGVALDEKGLDILHLGIPWLPAVVRGLVGCVTHGSVEPKRLLHDRLDADGALDSQVLEADPAVHAEGILVLVVDECALPAGGTYKGQDGHDDPNTVPRYIHDADRKGFPEARTNGGPD